MQRAAIARALINRPRVLLADEPTGNLDEQTGGDIIRLLGDLNRNDGLTIIMVTHNLDLVADTDRVVRLVDGRELDALRGTPNVRVQVFPIGLEEIFMELFGRDSRNGNGIVSGGEAKEIL